MKVLSDVDLDHFVLAPYRNSKLISPINIRDGEVNGGIYIRYHQFKYAHQLRQQFNSHNKDNPVLLYSHPSMTDLYVLDPITSFLPETPPKDVSFDGIIEYNLYDNSSFWWETDHNVEFKSYKLESNKYVTNHRIYGLSLNPGFIVSIISPKEKTLIFSFMGPENGIVGRSINNPNIIKQFNYIHEYWPELGITFELIASKKGGTLTYKMKPLDDSFSKEPRIICAKKEIDSEIMVIGETHIPGNEIIRQLESL
jgi:hypothetical protein